MGRPVLGARRGGVGLDRVAVAAELDGGGEEDGGQGEARPEAGDGEEVGGGERHVRHGHGCAGGEGVGASGAVDAVLEEFEYVAGAQGDDFEDTEGDGRKRGPEERGAAGPGGDHQEPAPDGGVTEGVDGYQVVEEHHGVLGQGQAGAEGGGIDAAEVEDAEIDE